MPASEYVSPNASEGPRPAHEYFSFNGDTGEIGPAGDLSPSEYTAALRTIRDIDLNDSSLAENDPRHLFNLRLHQRHLLIEELNKLDDFDAKVQMMFEFMLPDKPFSGFITTYLMSRFPDLARLLSRP